MNDLERIEQIIIGGDPQVRRKVALETAADIHKEYVAWLEEELNKVRIQYQLEEEVRRNSVRPPPFRIPPLWGQADKIDGAHE